MDLDRHNDEPSEQDFSPESTLNEVETLPYRLGFEETEQLRQLHEEAVAAIQAGQIGPIRDAWRRYEDATLPQIDVPDPEAANRSRAGLSIAKALMNKAAGQPVKYLGHIMAARLAASSEGWSDIEAILDHELDSFGSPAEYDQARGDHEASVGQYETATDFYTAAAAEYVEAELTSTPDEPRTQGVLSLRLAECYSALLELGEGDVGELRRGVFLSLQNAAEYLIGHPEQAFVLGLMDELGQQAWWRAMEETG